MEEHEHCEYSGLVGKRGVNVVHSGMLGAHLQLATSIRPFMSDDVKRGPSKKSVYNVCSRTCLCTSILPCAEGGLWSIRSLFLASTAVALTLDS